MLFFAGYAEEISESYSNVQKIWESLGTYDFRGTHKLFTYSFDLLFANVFFGIGTPGQLG